jgi:hypothetical protein
MIIDHNDLTLEEASLLPNREALSFFDGSNVAHVLGSNTALALNAGGFGPSSASATATQTISVTQS